MIDIDHYFDSPSDICKIIADREKKHRRLLKISQKTLADMTGVKSAVLVSYNGDYMG